ncbi:MAG: hypothetical protein BIFFINMI_00586 [Phycisphaerae bacterium]|nr:hypothetical protein [Phycisphaerae bacterium]
MKLPDTVLDGLREKLWTLADGLKWATLPDRQKTQYYENWSRDRDIGGVISRYIPDQNVRLYIKDTIMKPYVLDRLEDPNRVRKALGIPLEAGTAENYTKPHGLRLDDGRILCWGLAANWKNLIMAVHERSHLAAKARPFGLVLMYAGGRMQEGPFREMVEDAAKKLKIEKVIWLNGA